MVCSWFLKIFSLQKVKLFSWYKVVSSSLFSLSFSLTTIGQWPILWVFWKNKFWVLLISTNEILKIQKWFMHLNLLIFPVFNLLFCFSFSRVWNSRLSSFIFFIIMKYLKTLKTEENKIINIHVLTTIICQF